VTAPFRLEPVVLEHRHVRLEPLAARHRPDLEAHAMDAEVWRFMGGLDLSTPERLGAWVAGNAGVSGDSLAFAVVDRATGRAVGSTSLYDLSAKDRHLEVGRTWLGRAYWRTAFNTSCKRLLLAHAFETMGAIRVQLRANTANARSVAAIERLGATLEGRLRAFRVLADGSVHDLLVFSVLEAEWPAVRSRLDIRLERDA
jgi:RimJ/RimL family protein N-acetyltransferase